MIRVALKLISIRLVRCHLRLVYGFGALRIAKKWSNDSGVLSITLAALPFVSRIHGRHTDGKIYGSGVGLYLGIYILNVYALRDGRKKEAAQDDRVDLSDGTKLAGGEGARRVILINSSLRRFSGRAI